MFRNPCKRRRVSSEDQGADPREQQAGLVASIFRCQKRSKASKKSIVVVAAMTGVRLCEVVVSSSLTVNDLQKAVKAEHDFKCRIDFLYRASRLPAGDMRLLDVVDFEESSTVELGLVKMKEVIFDTLNDGFYREPPDVQICSDGSVRYVIFSIKGARNDAHIGLFPGAVDIRRPFYEFVIDGWGGDISGIRRGRGFPTMVEAYGALLHPNQAREFWMSVNSSTGDVAMGLGTDISQKRIMSCTDTAVLTPASIGLMTKHGASASWTFHM
mmetsp:Transcript_25420/g.41550  ORF Transcript_25420/g.41550 Transcript_25420/m.41550 type:complete len:270 (-) Transcript_25420:138-947(-)